MAKAFPIGMRVVIREWQEMPDGWNGEMFTKLMGKTAIISSGPAPGTEINARGYNYYLKGWEWSWRHVDLIPADLSDDPNMAFKMRDYGN